MTSPWDPIWSTPPEQWTAAWMESIYTRARGGAEVSRKPHVYIGVPSYQPTNRAVRESLWRIVDDLRANEILCTVHELEGVSLISYARALLSHTFLASTANYFLQIDNDTELMNISAVCEMIDIDRPILGLAYPHRDGSGRVVANPLRDPKTGAPKVELAPDLTIEVAHTGTGFFMLRRDCLIDLQVRHPELLHEDGPLDQGIAVPCTVTSETSEVTSDVVTKGEVLLATGEKMRVSAETLPLWSLFSPKLGTRPNGRRWTMGEDYGFCETARAAGYEVRVYIPPTLRHWGRPVAHTGHITTAWGFTNVRVK